MFLFKWNFNVDINEKHIAIITRIIVFKNEVVATDIILEQKKLQ